MDRLTGSRKYHGVGKYAAHLCRFKIANGDDATPCHGLEWNLARETADNLDRTCWRLLRGAGCSRVHRPYLARFSLANIDLFEVPAKW
jgi:hypothetical protein